MNHINTLTSNICSNFKFYKRPVTEGLKLTKMAGQLLDISSKLIYGASNPFFHSLKIMSRWSLSALRQASVKEAKQKPVKIEERLKTLVNKIHFYAIPILIALPYFETQIPKEYATYIPFVETSISTGIWAVRKVRAAVSVHKGVRSLQKLYIDGAIPKTRKVKLALQAGETPIKAFKVLTSGTNRATKLMGISSVHAPATLSKISSLLLLPKKVYKVYLKLLKSS